MNNYLSQINLGPIRGFGRLGLEGVSGEGAGVATTIFNKFLSGVIGLLTVIAGIWFIFQFIIGAIGILSSGGDKAKLESARNKITTGLIGLVVVIAGVFLLDIIGGLLGLDILNPAEFVENINQSQP